jgi:drug/metabolite transporter (DMT)-like permease
VNPALLIALGASVFFGAADFSGGLAAKRASAPLVTAFSCLGALLVLFLAMPFAPGTPTARDLAWGAAAGVCGAAGATLIYASLALGPAIVASPVFSVIGLVVPVLFGLFIGERPSAIAWAGVTLAMLCIPLLAWSTEGAGGHCARISSTLFVATIADSHRLVPDLRRTHRRTRGLLPLVVARGWRSRSLRRGSWPPASRSCRPRRRPLALAPGRSIRSRTSPTGSVQGAPIAGHDACPARRPR